MPKWILIDEKIKSDLQLSVFSAQVTISTLGIALVAILGGLFKEEIYGVNVLKYLTNDKPLIFKHKISIILQLALIVLSYIETSLGKYNFLVAIFNVSIIITIIMVIDIFYIFKGNGYLENEIYNYIISIFSKGKLQKNKLEQEIINRLKNETLIDIEHNRMLKLKNDLQLFKDILKKITYYNKDDKKVILEIYEDSISEVLNKIFEEKSSPKTMMAIECMDDLYGLCNKYNKETDNKTYLDIYEKVYYKIFNAIASVLMDDRDDNYKIISCQYNLYQNMYFEKIDGSLLLKNNIYLKNFSAKIYCEIKRKGFDNYNPSILLDFQKSLFNKLRDYIEFYNFCEHKQEKEDQVILQLCEYIKVLIYNNENQILKDTLFDDFEDMRYLDSEYKFIIIIYMYYLIEFENIIEEKLKGEIRDLINSNISPISNFLMYSFNFRFDKNNIKKIKAILSRWEEPPKYRQAKCLVMDNVVEKFILFYILERNNNVTNLVNELSLLIENDEFYIYSIYNDLNNKNNIEHQYINFKNLLYGNEVSNDEAIDKINLLRYAVTILYKDNEIKRSENEIITDDQVNIFKEHLKSEILKDYKKITESLNKKNRGQLINESMDITIKNITTGYLEKNKNDDIIKFTNSFIIRHIIKSIYEKIEKDRLKYNDKKILIRFFELCEITGIKTDTLIGYRDYFYGIEGIEKFKKFEINKNKIQDNNCNNCIITIDSSKFYFNITNISLDIKNKNIDEVCNELERNDKNQYFYNITNDIYIPFTKDELKTYLDNKIRDIFIKVDMEYSFEQEKIGAGIFLEFNNN